MSAPADRRDILAPATCSAADHMRSASGRPDHWLTASAVPADAGTCSSRGPSRGRQLFEAARSPEGCHKVSGRLKCCRETHKRARREFHWAR